MSETQKNLSSVESEKLPLADIQANILLAHGREHSWYLFIRFRGSDASVRNWISDFAEDSRIGVTSTRQQLENRKARQADKKEKKAVLYDGGLLTCFFLSNLGYRYLGFENERMPADDSFQKGMRNGAVNAALQDPPSGYWERNYQRPIHAMIMLADDHEARLEARLEEIERRLWTSGAGSILFMEKGEKLRVNGHPVEHFGYRDGIAQPRLWGEDGQLLKNRWRIALVEEGNGRYGSYLVFRKLEQNVKAFHEELEELEKSAGISKENTGAQAVGRFLNGSQLTLFDRLSESFPDQFDYNEDNDGQKCPFHAHIRKANPRHPALIQDKREIIRRGVPYGERLPDLSDRPARGCGLLFTCYQASITEQFEHITKNWLNNPGFPRAGTGPDPLVGQMITGRSPQSWNRGWNQPAGEKHDHGFREVVQLKGGRYFYAPSISFLANLKQGRRGTGTRSVTRAERTRSINYSFRRSGFRYGHPV